jgi:hypothetical protein
MTKQSAPAHARIKEGYMRYLKILGLAAITALTLMAVVGANSASATELCTVNTSPCPAASKYNSGTVIEASSTNATFTTSLGNVVCTGSSIKGATTSSGGSKSYVEGKLESLTFSFCTLTTPFGATSHTCMVTAIDLFYRSVTTKTTHPNGTLSLSFGVLGDPGIKVDCGASVLRCRLNSVNVTLDLNGGSPATVLAKEEPWNRTVYEGGLCPTSATWDATYTVTKPHALYLVN